MPTGSLRLHITDLLDQPIDGRIDIDFAPARESPGGTQMQVRLDTPGETDFIISELECRGGPGTLYTVRIRTKNFRSYAFFQMILEDKTATSSDNNIRLIVNPGKVQDIAAPGFDRLDSKLRTYLSAAVMQEVETGDRDLLGLQGAELYQHLGSLRKAALLNIFAKASHASSDKCFRFLETPRVLRQDRCFCTVNADMQKFLEKSERFRSVPDKLHQPLEGFQLENSFKSRDAHANLQVTFMRNGKTGELAADVDIDESAGIEHGFEVIRNAVKSSRTNPYLVRELLLLVDPVEKILDPGYQFIF